MTIDILFTDSLELMTNQDTVSLLKMKMKKRRVKNNYSKIWIITKKKIQSDLDFH